MVEITRNAIVLFGFEVHWYGLLIALGVLAAVLLACRREKRLGFAQDTTLNIALICVPAAIICARLYYVVFSWDYYAAHPGQIFNIRQGGMAIYGGVIGGILAGYIYCRVKKLSFRAGLDLAAPSIALGQAIGRWGNFLNQEAYGRAVANPRLQFFPVAVQIEGTWHYAAFFYESMWCLLIVAFILIAEKKNFFRRRGDIFGAYVFLYSLERAIVENLRTDSLMLGSLRISQAVSLVALLVVVSFLSARTEDIPRRFSALLVPEVLLLDAALDLAMPVFTAISAFILIAHTAAVYLSSNHTTNI